MRAREEVSRYAVGLYRVSTAEQGQSGLGLEAQQASVRAFAAAQGWTLVAEFSDVASDKDDSRPGFQAALAAAGSSARCWPRRAWTGSRAGRTRCPSCSKTATRSAPPTCRGPTTG